MHRDVVDLEVQRQTLRDASRDQVLDDLGLAVDHDAAPGQIAQRDAMALAVELELDPVVHQPLAAHAIAHTGLLEQVDRSLLEDSRPDPVLAVLAAARLEDHRVDALQLQELRQHQAGRACADDADLRSGHSSPGASSTRWATAKAPFAAGTPQ